MILGTPEPTPPETQTLKTKVFGVTHTNPDGTDRQHLIRQCRVFNGLSLRHDPENEHDDCAIEVHRLGVGQIGFIGRHRNAEIVEFLEGGGQPYARITDITGGTPDKPTLGVNIDVFLDEPDSPNSYGEAEVETGPDLGDLFAMGVVFVVFFLLFTALSC